MFFLGGLRVCAFMLASVLQAASLALTRLCEPLRSHSTMFRRALSLGARVSVASCAAVVPAITACLSDSRTQRIEINDFGAVTGGASTGSCTNDRDRRRGLLVVKNLAKTAEFWPRSRAGGFAAIAHKADPAENAVAVAVN